MNIGLTGGIATGKSTVARMLAEKGAVIIDADQVAREVVMPGSAGLAEVVERFGAKILHEDGSLNRAQLGRIVFHDKQAKADLEAILHPKIRAIMKSRMEQLEKEDPRRLVVADIPLLFELDLQQRYDETMLVYVPQPIQKQRLMERDGLSPEEAEARIRSQMPIEEKKKIADIIIDNRGTIEETMQQIDQFWERKKL